MFDEAALLKLAQNRFFIAICATGKTTLVSKDQRFVDVDAEEWKFKDELELAIGKNGNFSPSEEEFLIKVREDFIHGKILEYLKEGKIVLSAAHGHIFEFVREEKIPYVVIQYSPEDVDEFKNRMRQRGNSEEFIEKMLGDIDKSYVDLKNDEFAIMVIDIKKDQYLSDFMWEIFGKP